MQSHAPARGRHDISKIDKWGRKRGLSLMMEVKAHKWAGRQEGNSAKDGESKSAGNR